MLTLRPWIEDVHLIVPTIINRWTGLLAAADEVLDNTMDLVLHFLREHHQPMRTKTQMIREWQGPLTRPLGEPGDIHWHPVGDETLAFTPSVDDANQPIKANGGGSNKEEQEQEFEERVGSIDEGRERFDGSIDAKLVLNDTAEASKKRDEMVES